MSPNFATIFFHPGSMTKILKELSRYRLSLDVLEHAWQKPQYSESTILSSDHAWGIGREVVMSGVGQPWLYGRTFFPETVVKAQGNDFLFLGSRPLGELLFSNPQISRGEFSVARLLPGHREYQDAAQALQQFPEYLWARRSEFFLPSGEITLLEVFSPKLEKAATKSVVV
jgi:chorismate--pyruvate lyase